MTQLLHLIVFDHILWAEDRPMGEVILPIEQLVRLGGGKFDAQQSAAEQTWKVRK